MSILVIENNYLIISNNNEYSETITVTIRYVCFRVVRL